jgi:hypothetical protein
VKDLRRSVNQAIARIKLFQQYNKPLPPAMPSYIATQHITHATTAPPILDCGAQSTSMPLSELPNTYDSSSIVTAILPNGSKIKSIDTTSCNYNGLMLTANVYKNKDMQRPLVAADDFTRQGHEITLTNTGVTITKPDGSVLLHHPKVSERPSWRVGRQL